MSLEFVTVNAGGFGYSGFQTVEITAGANQAVRTFRVTTNDPAAAGWSIPAGCPATILASGTPVCVGYVEDFSPSFDANNHIVELAGKSKSMDFVDCSAIKETGRFEDKTPLDIANELDLFGIGFSAEIPMKQIPWFQIRQGETAFNAVERVLKDHGGFMQGMGDGSIKITKGGKSGRQSGAIVEGQNLLAGSSKHTTKGRHSEIEVKGQSTLGTGDSSTRPKGKATDGAMKRYRPLVIINEGETDKARADERALAHAKQSAGRAESAEITIAGWRLGGAIIEPNKLVFIQSPKLRLNGDMLIKSVTFTQDATNGTTAKMTLVDPRSLEGEAAKSNGGGNKSAGTDSGTWGGVVSQIDYED